jgi:hypothetical protein
VPPPDVLCAITRTHECSRTERATERSFTRVLTLVPNQTTLVGEFLASAFVARVALPFALSSGLTNSVGTDEGEVGRMAPPDVLGAVAGANECSRTERATERSLAGVLTLVSSETTLVGEFLASAFLARITLAVSMSSGLVQFVCRKETNIGRP